MAVDFRRITDAHFLLIARALYVTDELTNHLIVAGILSQSQVNEVLATPTLDAKVTALLKILHGIATDELISKFLSILREHDQAHVANVYRAESEVQVMSEERFELLKFHVDELRRYIDPVWSGLVEVMMRDGVFNQRDAQRVDSVRTYDEKSTLLVFQLSRKCNSAFDKFLAALQETGHYHVIKILTQQGDQIPMTEEHVGLVVHNMDKLRRYIDPENGLLEYLASDGVLSVGQHNFIRSHTTYDDKVIELLHIIIRKADVVFDKFINALKYTGQSHCVFIMTGEGDPPLSDESAEKLNRLRASLTSTSLLIQNGFLDSLVSRAVLTSSDCQRIQKMEKLNDKNVYIIDMMARKSQRQFQGFVAALRESGQNHVAVLLDGEAAVAGGSADQQVLVDFMTQHSVQKELLSDMDFQAQTNNTYPNPKRNPETDGTNPSMQKLLKELEAKGIAISGVDKDTFGIRFRCYTPDALRNLKNLCETHELDQLLTEAYAPTFGDRGLLSININIPDDEFGRCEETFRKNALMSNAHHEALQLCAQFMGEKIKVTESLLNRLNLCKRRKQAVTCCEKGPAQVSTLMDIVSRQPDIAFQQMIDALRATDQDEAADFLVAAEQGKIDPERELKELVATPAPKEFL